MAIPPTAVEKGFVLNTRTGAVYGAAVGFAVGLGWQCIAGYPNPLPLWRGCLGIGALLGGSLGLGYVLATRRHTPERPPTPDAENRDVQNRDANQREMNRRETDGHRASLDEPATPAAPS